MKHFLHWFTNRIGKVVYRNDSKKHGVKIQDLTHAKYLHMIQDDLDVNYRDKI